MMDKLAFLPKKEYMRRALDLAREAAAAGEVPVGAVVVREGQVLGEGRNRREAGRSALAHAELEAIAQACQRLGTWRLTGCQLYVTLEPCPMCTGAIINAHIDTRWSTGRTTREPAAAARRRTCSPCPYSHRPEVYRGFYEEECRELLRSFFQHLRNE